MRVCAVGLAGRAYSQLVPAPMLVGSPPAQVEGTPLSLYCACCQYSPAGMRTPAGRDALQQCSAARTHASNGCVSTAWHVGLFAVMRRTELSPVR